MESKINEGVSIVKEFKAGVIYRKGDFIVLAADDGKSVDAVVLHSGLGKNSQAGDISTITASYKYEKFHGSITLTQ